MPGRNKTISNETNVGSGSSDGSTSQGVDGNTTLDEIREILNRLINDVIILNRSNLGLEAKQKGLEEKQKEITQTQTTTKTQLTKQQRLIKDSVSEVIGQKTDLIQILAVFVSIFTFISVEIQIFRLPLNLAAVAGLTLILFAAIALMMGLLMVMLRVIGLSKLVAETDENAEATDGFALPYPKKWILRYLGVAGLIALIGVILTGVFGSSKPDQTILKDYEQATDKSLKQREEELNRRTEALDDKYQALEEKIGQLILLSATDSASATSSAATQSTSRPQN